MNSEALVIVGASGFVGAYVRRAAVAGERIVVSRKALNLLPGERLAQCALDRPDALIGVVPRRSVVLNLAYDAGAGHDANVALADTLAAVCVGVGAERLVHVSTATVTGLVRERWVSESTGSRPVTAYQRTKLAVEERLRDGLRGVCPLVILRPTAVFGAGGLNLRKLVADLKTRPWYENYARACLFGARPTNLVPVETVAAAVVFAAASPSAIHDGVYLVADDESAENNFRDVEAIMRRGLHLPPYPIPPVPLPTSVLTTALRASGRFTLDPRTRFSSARLDSAGFRRPVTFLEALTTYAVVHASTPAGANA